MSDLHDKAIIAVGFNYRKRAGLKQNYWAAAGVLTKTSLRAHISPLLACLPVKPGIEYEVLLFTY